MSIYDTSMFNFNAVANPDYVFKGDKYRITLLTSQMFRLEYSENGSFEDRPTRFAINRNFDTPEYEKYYQDGMLHIKTEHIHIIYDEKELTSNGFRVIVNGSIDWCYGNEIPEHYNLKGTCRTLDGTDGECKLDNGLNAKSNSISEGGVALVDDSKTIVFGEDGWALPLISENVDLYVFCYCKDYEKCIKDFYKLSGAAPLLPRYALGNWWSRYHKYTDEEYSELIAEFKKRKIPLSVGVIDMDWHIVDTPDPVKYGNGWTGFSWNKDLFPDPEDFLKRLKSNKLITSLNLHPKDGIRAYEDAYETIARRMGIDPTTERQVEFDVSDREFMEAYFECVLHPLEKQGVDFWWLDWQQTGHTKVEGYDTLWMLNHCHYVDSAKDGNRPLTFSRYAGIGSHRYPIGFSGDTATTWETLDFQPYFTATASNVGYSWWSHDIGGHHQGIRDDELYVRWLQFGVFSPINRLHCTDSMFCHKEPWSYGIEAQTAATDLLRLRHNLVPYLFTMMYRNTQDGIPLIRPIYHKYPDMDCDDRFKNEYLFGDSFIVAPITQKADREAAVGQTNVWLPEGKFIDLFNGRIYNGGRAFKAYRGLDEMPVFAKAGAIVPLCADVDSNGTDNPSALELLVFGGNNGGFTMIEDNGLNGEKAQVMRTEYALDYGENTVLSFVSPKAIDTVPKSRKYSLVLYAFSRPESVTAVINGTDTKLDFEFDRLTNRTFVKPFEVGEGDEVKVIIKTDGKLPENEIRDNLFKLTDKAQYDTLKREELYYKAVYSGETVAQRVQSVVSLGYNPQLTGAVIEILCANK